jgi:hemerythrin-like domain-containing protein
MDVIEMLKRQHEEVRDVLERMVAEDDARESRALLAQLSKSLRLHMHIEERLVYPAAARAFTGDDDDEETVIEAYEDHALARHTLETLEATPPSDKRFVVRVKIVSELVNRHIDEEESELLPELESKLGRDGMQRLGDQVERRLPELEAEASRGPTARKGQRAGRTRAARSARSTRAARASASSGRGSGAKAQRSTRKPRGRANGGKTRTSSSRENNGNKPRRGESTSR